MQEGGQIMPDRPAGTGISPLPQGPPAGAEAPAGAGPSRPGWPSEVRWTALEVVAVVFVSTLCLSLTYETLRATEFYEWFYGHRPGSPPPGGMVGDVGPLVGESRRMLWASAFAFVPQLALTLALLHAGSGTRPAELGLTTRRLGRNVLAGVVAGAVLIPGVTALQLLIVELYQALGAPGVQEHPFSAMARDGLLPVEWVLLVFCATVAAPVWEELFFRGLLQPWFATRPWGGHVALAGAFFYALAKRGESILSAAHEGLWALLEAGVPVLVLLALVPVYLLVWKRSRTPVGPALFGTAVLFAWVHVSAWPSPVPLLLLGLGLGYLAFRTRSLVGPIVLHSLVNLTACAVLYVQLRRG